MAILAHLVIIIPLYVKSRNYDNDHKLFKSMRVLFGVFTFDIYIRTAVESYLLIVTSSLTDLWENSDYWAIVYIAY